MTFTRRIWSLAGGIASGNAGGFWVFLQLARGGCQLKVNSRESKWPCAEGVQEQWYRGTP